MLAERTSNSARRLPYWAIFGLKREKTIVMLDFNRFNLSKCNISSEKKLFQM